MERTLDIHSNGSDPAPPTNADPRAPPDQSQRPSTEPPDPQFVPGSEFLESEYRESQAEARRELQLVLDPDFL